PNRTECIGYMAGRRIDLYSLRRRAKCQGQNHHRRQHQINFLGTSAELHESPLEWLLCGIAAAAEHQQPLSTISRTERFSANCLSYQQNEPMSCWNLSGSPKLGCLIFS